MTGSAEILEQWLARFEAALEDPSLAGVADLFDATCYWRDMVAFTWNIKTMEGQDAISAMLAETLSHVQPGGWTLEGEASEADGAIGGWFSFETRAGTGKGHVRLKDGKCWTLLTTLTNLTDHPFKEGPARSRGVEHGAHAGKKHWGERRRQEIEEIGTTRQPYCLIIGGGQGGMALAARFAHLDVPALIVDKHERPGDSWRTRYESLCLHDPVWYDHMPYIPFPDGWPVFTPKDMMADWLEMYARVMQLNYWSATTCTKASYNQDLGQWAVTVDRGGTSHTLHPSHLVFATGMSGYPQVPKFPGRELFSGEQLHASKYRTGAPFAGKRCVVIGSNTSAHDICADLWEHGADVTMVQRSGSLVVQTETVLDRVLGPLYSEEALAAGIDMETADYMSTTWPH
ncbi:MAG: NAD(P)/FAD-dependent oxidoreductase, partial [Rhizobiales bacterium]|nr:NAD(P)/FAD-dependent oxidoreductase [Hyphomicrobiales bacterium]